MTSKGVEITYRINIALHFTAQQHNDPQTKNIHPTYIKNIFKHCAINFMVLKKLVTGLSVIYKSRQFHLIESIELHECRLNYLMHLRWRGMWKYECICHPVEDEWDILGDVNFISCILYSIEGNFFFVCLKAVFLTKWRHSAFKDIAFNNIWMEISITLWVKSRINVSWISIPFATKIRLLS